MNIIDWVLYIPLTLCVCYLLLYAIASKFYRAPQYPEARTLRHIAVLFPAYKEAVSYTHLTLPTKLEV